MADATLRDLERRAALGDAEAMARWREHRLRLGLGTEVAYPVVSADRFSRVHLRGTDGRTACGVKLSVLDDPSVSDKPPTCKSCNTGSMGRLLLTGPSLDASNPVEMRAWLLHVDGRRLWAVVRWAARFQQPWARSLLEFAETGQLFGEVEELPPPVLLDSPHGDPQPPR